MKLRVVLILFLLLIFSCSKVNLAENKKQEWGKKIEKFMPIGKTRNELIRWQKLNGTAQEIDSVRSSSILETVKSAEFFCSKKHISLSINTDSNFVISNYTISISAVCL